MKKFFVSLLGLLFMISSTMLAQAQPRGEKSGPMHRGDKGRCPMMGHFKMMDTDKDGKVSLKEWEDFHAKMFKDMDKNGDGFLSDDEMKPPKGPKPGK